MFLRILLLVLVSAGAFVLSLPGLNFSALAWVFLVPFALYAMRKPSWRTWLWASGAFCYFSGVLELIWLRHIYPPLGWLALLLLPLPYRLFPFLWLLLLRWILPQCSGKRPFFFRLVGLLGLAGAWLVGEWILTWFLSGFPWMPLAATQWDFPAILALCPYGGPYFPSFILVLFNLGLARYIWRQFVEVRKDLLRGNEDNEFPPLRFLKSVCPEFYCALIPVFLSFFVFAGTCLNYHENAEKKFSFAAIQTDFDPNMKWDSSYQEFCENVVVDLSRAAPKDADFLMWPEAVLPYLVVKNGRNGYDAFLSSLSREIGKPILFGGITPEPKKKSGYYNSVHIVDPKFGLVEEFAAKQHLVPFGEYVPLAEVFPLRKVVPIELDCLAGTQSEPLRLRLGGKVLRVGALVCYEDVFPELGRELVNKGAEVLAVVTNDAWYGKEAGAYQHMAHSVLSAVSLGVPVIRCGNAGWSGVISPIGQIQKMANEQDSIYFRGVKGFDVYAWREKPQTIYAKWGDYFVGIGAFGAVLAGILCRPRKKSSKAS